MKKMFFRILSLSISICVLATATTGCKASPKDISFTEQLFQRIKTLRRELDLATMLSDEHCYIAIGTVDAVEYKSDDIFPLFLNESFDYGDTFPAEVWNMDNSIFTVTIDSVINSPPQKTYHKYEQLIFNVPNLFKKISYWNDGAPVFSGENFTYADPNTELPGIGEKIIIAIHPTYSDPYFIEDEALIIWNDKQIDCGKIDLCYIGDKYKPYSLLDKYTDPTYRLNAPLPEDYTLLETSWIYPMQTLAAMSDTDATNWSDDIVSGTVVSVEQYDHSPFSMNLHYMNRQYTDAPLEVWEVNFFVVMVEVTSVIKAGDTPVNHGAHIMLYVPTEFRQKDNDKVIHISGIVPNVGDSIQLWWKEKTPDNINECHAATTLGNISILSTILDQNPSDIYAIL